MHRLCTAKKLRYKMSNFGRMRGIEDKDPTWMKKNMFIKCSLEPRFYAFHMVQFAFRYRLSWPELVSFFEATQEQMFSLGMCVFSREEEKIRKASEFTEMSLLLNESFQQIFFEQGVNV